MVPLAKPELEIRRAEAVHRLLEVRQAVLSARPPPVLRFSAESVAIKAAAMEAVVAVAVGSEEEAEAARIQTQGAAVVDRGMFVPTRPIPSSTPEVALRRATRPTTIGKQQATPAQAAPC